jgi:hypothetical protein
MRLKNGDGISISDNKYIVGPILNRKQLKYEYYELVIEDDYKIHNDITKYGEFKKVFNKNKIKKLKYIETYDKSIEIDDLIQDFKHIYQIKKRKENYLSILGFDDEKEYTNYYKMVEQLYKNIEKEKMNSLVEKFTDF